MADLGKLFRIEDYPSLQCSRGAGTPDGGDALDGRRAEQLASM